jgi:uncharacterized protein
MSSDQGKFVWYELMTSDTSAAETFYDKVVGWKTRDAGLPGMAYTLLSAGAADVGGVMKLPADAAAAGAKPFWIGYIAVDNVDAQAAAVAQAGGRIHREPDDIPGVGRFAVISDPQGTTFALFAPKGPEARQATPPGAPGHVGWHELYAVNGAEAFAFYSKFFGWTKGEALDMGAMGIYQIFAVENRPIGGIMTKMEAMPVPFWLFYFNVEEIKAAAERVRAAGGQVAMDPHQVPGGSWIIQCIDPQGAMFALVEPHR